MALVTKGKTFANGELVTPAKLHQLVDSATVTNIGTADVSNNAVTTAKIADANVTTAKIADSNVTTAKIADANVTTAKIADSAITSAKIADGTIVNADISSSAAIALSKLATGALPTGITIASANIVDGTIVNADISNSAAIADTKLATISTAGKVSNSATTATSSNTANAIVTRDASGNFSAGTITANLTGNVTGNVTGNAATASTLANARTIALGTDASGSVSFNGSTNVTIPVTIANNAVTTAKIADAAVTTAKIADSAVTDAKISSLSFIKLTGNPYKDNCLCATTSNLAATYNNGSNGIGATLTNSGTLGALSIDSITVSLNSRVLVKNQTSATQNGIYTCTNAGSSTTAWVLTRATDADNSAEVRGAVVTIDRGTTNGGKFFTTSFASTGTIGITSQSWFPIITEGDSGTVSTPMLANEAVTTAKIADEAVTTAKIANSAISTAKIANSAVTDDTLANNAVTTAKIADSAVTDAKISSLSFIKLTGNPYKDNCLCATTGNLTATYNNGSSGVGATLTNSGTLGALSIDGITVTLNSRVLVKNQTSATQNGIYFCTNAGGSTTAWVLTRATDADQSAEVRGAVVTIDRGTTNGGKFFTTSFNSTGAIGSTNQSWFQIITNGDSKTVSTAMLADGAVTLAKADFPSNFPLQMVQAVKTDTQEISETGNVWEDITGLSLTLTRNNASSSGKVRIQAVIQNSTNSSNHGLFFQILRETTAIGLGSAAGNRLRATAQSHHPYSSSFGQTSTVIDFIDNSPGSSATVTYKIQARTYNTFKGWINRSNNDSDAADYIARTISTLTLTELSP